MKNTIHNKIILVMIKKIINYLAFIIIIMILHICALSFYNIVISCFFLPIDLQKLDLYEKTFLAPRENRKSNNLRISTN